jgi:hypothetical protein
VAGEFRHLPEQHRVAPHGRADRRPATRTIVAAAVKTSWALSGSPTR